MLIDQIDKNLLDLANQSDEILKDIYKEIDDICFYNSNRILSSFIENNVSYSDFSDINGYGNYDEGRDKYYAEITMDKALRGDIEKVRPKKLRYRNTPEEAFADYKKHKEAYIIMMADKYMDYLPVEIYDALIDYEVEPF